MLAILFGQFIQTLKSLQDCHEREMYSGFVGTVLSHFLSLISSLWSVFQIHNYQFHNDELIYIRIGLLLVTANSSLGLIRYGSHNGYKLRRLHIILLNSSTILYFTIFQVLFLQMIKSNFVYLSALNLISLLANVIHKDYRTKLKYTDICIAINLWILLLISLFSENYYGIAFCLSYFFGYFVVGDSGYFLDTELPAIDAFQYLTCFSNFFSISALCS